MRLLLMMICFFFLHHSFCYGQEFYPIRKDLFNWKKYEQADKKQIIAFIKAQKSYFQQFENKDAYSNLTMDTLIKSLHFIDLDKDGIAEVIFDGPSGGEGNETIIFQKINGKYQQVFSGIQSVVDIQWQYMARLKSIFPTLAAVQIIPLHKKYLRLRKLKIIRSNL